MSDTKIDQDGVERGSNTIAPGSAGTATECSDQAFEAEDAAQEALRVHGAPRIGSGRSSLRVAVPHPSNVCFDTLRAATAGRPIDLVGSGRALSPVQPPLPQSMDRADPRRGVVSPTAIRPSKRSDESRCTSHSSPRFSHLPAATARLTDVREVLKWKAGEVAELLETSVASVNSALQRARAGLANAAYSRRRSHAN